MKEFLKRYKVTLTALAPVFVGTSHTIGKKEWILDKENDVAVIPDELKLMKYLKKRNLLESFESFLLSDKKTLMFEWAVRNNIYPKDKDLICKYSLSLNKVNIDNKDNEIYTFVKDGHGLPYLPGSTIKGAVRNILLSSFISSENESEAVSGIRKGLTLKDRKRVKREERMLEQNCFNKRNLPETKENNNVNDIMSGIRFSDSLPLSFDDLIICRKIDVNTQNSRKRMPVLRECIKPGTVIQTEMTIDTAVVRNIINREYIEAAIGSFLENYNREFLSKFDVGEQYSGQVIYLGGGSGYHTKTSTGSLLENQKDRVELTSKIIEANLDYKVRMKHKHFNDKKTGVSPHVVKCTLYDNKLYQFGPCRIEFEEI